MASYWTVHTELIAIIPFALFQSRYSQTENGKKLLKPDSNILNASPSSIYDILLLWAFIEHLLSERVLTTHLCKLSPSLRRLKKCTHITFIFFILIWPKLIYPESADCNCMPGWHIHSDPIYYLSKKIKIKKIPTSPPQPTRPDQAPVYGFSWRIINLKRENAYFSGS